MSIVNIKKTTYEYEKIKQFKAGVVLEGWMVKSIRKGKISASDGVYAKVINGELVLMGLNIQKLQTTSSQTYASEKPTIKLLLNKKELNEIIGAEAQKGLTVVLKSLFWERHLVKADIWLAKGKNTQDKRKTIKDRDNARDLNRVMKKYN